MLSKGTVIYSGKYNIKGVVHSFLYNRAVIQWLESNGDKTNYLTNEPLDTLYSSKNVSILDAQRPDKVIPLIALMSKI